MRIQQVTEHITRLEARLPIPTCMWVVSHDDGHLLVDAGLRMTNPVKELERAGFKGQPTHLLITHGHADHTGGAPRLLNSGNVEVVASAEESPFIDGTRRYAELARSGRQRGVLTVSSTLKLLEGPAVKVDRAILEGESIGGLRAIALPGHTPGQTGYVHEEDGAVIIGDALFNFFGRLSHDPFVGIDLDRDEIRRSLAKLVDLDIDVVLPSHGPAILSDGSARIERFLG